MAVGEPVFGVMGIDIWQGLLQWLCAMSDHYHTVARFGDQESTRVALHGLVVACPFDQGNPEDCQLCKIRKEPLMQRFTFIESLSPEEIDELLEVHTACLARKEEEERRQFFPSREDVGATCP